MIFFTCGRLMIILKGRPSLLHTTAAIIRISFCLIWLKTPNIQNFKILQMYIKTCKYKFMYSCCFLSIPLRKFSDTFNLSNVVKGTFPHCCNTSNNYEYVGLLPAVTITHPTVLKNLCILNSLNGMVRIQTTSLFYTARFTNIVRLACLC